MEKNMFENAYFGKAYKTNDNEKFIYLGKVESCDGKDIAIQGLIEDDEYMSYYTIEGKSLCCEYRGSAINAYNIDFNSAQEEDTVGDIVGEWNTLNDGEDLAMQYAENSLFGNKTKKQVAYNAYLAAYKKAINGE